MKFRNLDLTNNPINQEHLEIGIPLVEESVTHSEDHPLLKIAMWLALFLLTATLIYFCYRLLSGNGVSGTKLIIGEALVSDVFWWSLLVGLIAQIIDGALGMAYGITATTFLLATGSSPVIASASVHIAEVFTTGVSGVSHVKLGNVNKPLFLKLLFPGILGAVTGAYILTSVDGNFIKPFISLYLLFMGFYILSKVFLKIKKHKQVIKHVAKLGFVGGLIDTLGGGGWGPVVTTTLISSSSNPRLTIGTVNFVEFFLTFASAIAFLLLVGEAPWIVVSGLVIGGVFAAPFAAILCKKVPAKLLMVLVGILIIIVSTYNIYNTFVT